MNQRKESFGRPDYRAAAALGNRTRAGCMNQGKESFGRPDTGPLPR